MSGKHKKRLSDNEKKELTKLVNLILDAAKEKQSLYAAPLSLQYHQILEWRGGFRRPNLETLYKLAAIGGVLDLADDKIIERLKGDK